MATVFGLSDPTFVIAKDGKYYLTLSVLEYDPAAIGASASLKAGVAAIAAAFNAGQKFEAAVVAFSMVTSAAQTRPRHVNVISMAQTNPIAPDE